MTKWDGGLSGFIAGRETSSTQMLACPGNGRVHSTLWLSQIDSHRSGCDGTPNTADSQILAARMGHMTWFWQDYPKSCSILYTTQNTFSLNDKETGKESLILGFHASPDLGVEMIIPDRVNHLKGTCVRMGFHYNITLRLLQKQNDELLLRIVHWTDELYVRDILQTEWHLTISSKDTDGNWTSLKKRTKHGLWMNMLVV